MSDLATPSYCVISGWYADETARTYRTHGSDFVRSVACFPLWYHCVNQFTSPTRIFVADSASPWVPRLPADPRIEWTRLGTNYGHSAEGRTPSLGGWSRGLLLGLAYAHANGDPYTALIEQGSLFYGPGIVERLIERYPDADVIAPSGEGTPQPIGTGIMVFRTSVVPEFIARYSSIPEPDPEFDTERKTVFASGPKLAIVDLPFGRRRPLDFSVGDFFFRHGLEDELRAFTEKIGYGQDLVEAWHADPDATAAALGRRWSGDEHALRGIVESMQASASWRVTKPLRESTRLLRACLRRPSKR